jgi:Ca2+-binding RTX toxin-like protein
MATNIGTNAVDTINGKSFADLLFGRGGNDVLKGNDGNDYLDGGKGNDNLSGGAGNDEIEGGAGNDMIDGGAGNDILSGDGGNDTFIYKTGYGKDTIEDFQIGQDTIKLTAGSKLDTYKEVAANAKAVGKDVVIKLDANNTLTIKGMTLKDFKANIKDIISF